MKISMVLAAAATLAAGAAFAQAARPNEFLADAIKGDNAEVQMGRLAMSRGASKDVRDFGKMLVADHTRGGADARKLARIMKVKAPSGVPDDAKETRQQLMKLKGADFDKGFAQAMVEDHRKDIAKYQAIANESQDQQLKDFAAKQIPVLQKHLDAAEKLPQ